MPRIILTLAALLLALPLAAQAQQVKAFQIVGVTILNVAGDAGVFGMTQQCQVEYPNSRMCTSEEAMASVTIHGTGSPAWVRPAFVPGATGQTSTWTFDASGALGTSLSLTCMQWTSALAQHSGLVMLPGGGFGQESCDEDRPVACCAFIPIPEPPSAAVLGAGALSLAAMSKAKRAAD